MSIRDLRSFNQVPASISLELSDDAVVPTVRGANNVVYFTREQFSAGLRFPIPSLVNHFLHFTRAPPALTHLNVFRILMSCSVLNVFYHLDISLVEICFIYTLKLRAGCRLSMLARLQFVTELPNSPKTKIELPNSPKTKAKGVVLVKGMWYETPCSLSLPLYLNQSLSFPSLSQLDGACSFLSSPSIF